MRFYKTIAISFLLVTLALLGIVIFFTSKKATIVIVAKSDNKNINFNVTVDGQKSGNTTIPGAVTSTLFTWTQKYYPTGNKTVDDVAIGEVILYNETSASQILVKTTRLLTQGGVLFHLSERALVPAKGQVIAQVYADKKGASGDIGPSKFTIPGLAEDKQKFIFAESKKAMEGGVGKVGILSEEDIKLAQQDYLEKVKAAALSEVQDLANYNQKLISIPDYEVVADRKVGEEVAEYNLIGTSTVRVVYYNKESLKVLVERESAKKVDVESEKVLSVNREPQVSLVSYDMTKNSAQISIYQDILVTLDANAEKLTPSNFFNKSKDEIERYVFGFGHVIGVDVKFSPSWMRTAPAVQDRVKVIVKNVE